MKTKKNFGILFIPLFLFIYSCEQEIVNFNGENELIENEYFINLDQAKLIAKGEFSNGVQTRNIQKSIKAISKLSYSSKNTEMYLFNYEGGGWMIVSADKRVGEVLAYSDTGSFQLDENKPDGLIDWLQDYSNTVSYVRNKGLTMDEVRELTVEVSTRASNSRNIELGKKGKIAQAGYQGGYYNCQYEDEILPRTIYKTPQLMNTKWGQGKPYNNNVPVSCTFDRAPAGCVAIAMAQIMTYNKKPTRFNWSLLYQKRTIDGYSSVDESSRTEVAKLVAEIGRNVSMEYDCGGSGANISNALASFKNNYGYSSAKIIQPIRNSDHIYKIWDNVADDHPVYMRGTDRNGEGHAWVVDGMEIHNYRRCYLHRDDSGDRLLITSGFYVEYYYSINWGWNGDYDGLYSYNSLKPQNSTGFIYDNMAIIDLK